MSPNIYLYIYIHICTYAFFGCPFVQLRLHINAQSYWHSNIIPDEMPVFVSTGNSVLTARTGHYTPLPFGCSPLTRPLEVRALLQPPVSQTALREIPTMPWGRMCFAAVFMVPFGFSKSILVRPLYLVPSDTDTGTSLGLLAVWHSEPGQACESFQSWGPGMTTLRILGLMGLGMLEEPPGQPETWGNRSTETYR